jgi:DNA-binding NarL/FixJ family response regulator
VAQAQDGCQVLDVVQQHEPDILLLDLKIPGPDGLAILQRLSIVKNKTRVIILAASEDDKDAFIEAMKLGACGIILKQNAPELLVRSIRKVHAGEIWLDSHTTAAVIRQFIANDETPVPVLTMPPVPPHARARTFLAQPARARNRGLGVPRLHEQGDCREDVHQPAGC